MSVHLSATTLSSTTDSMPQNFTDTHNSSDVGPGVKVAPCLLLGACFMVGLPVNIAVIFDICRNYKRYASKVNPKILLLVLNLALVDSVALTTSPLTLYTLVWGFTLGDATCQMLYFILTSCLFISVVTVTGISINYFLMVKLGVANPRLMAQVSGRRRLVVFLGGVWALALLFSISTLFTRRVEHRKGLLRCIRKAHNDTVKVSVLLMETVLGYVLPFSTLLTSYVCLYRKTTPRTLSATSTEQSKKLKHFVVSVLVTFLLCWTPYHIINIIDVATTLLISSAPAYELLKRFRDPAGDGMKSLCLLNSTINPFLYAFALRRKLNRSQASSMNNTGMSTDMTLDMSMDMTAVSESPN